MDLNPNVLYLTWGETIVNNGIFDNQVFELLKEIRRQHPSIQLTLLCGIPFVNQRLFRQRQKLYSEVAAIEESLQQTQVEFTYRWIPAVARWFHSQPHHFFFYSAGQQRFLHRFISQRRIDVVHCRGYHAARIALQVRERYSAGYRVIFDTRGLFPEEGVYAGHFAKESRAYVRWKTVEQKLLDNSDAVVNVSNTFSQYVRTLTNNKNIQTICTTTNLDIFSKWSAQKESVRQKLNIARSTKVLVYLGSIGVNQGWHRLDTLIALYRAFRQAFTNTHLLIITRTSHSQLKEVLNQHADLESSYQLISSRTPDETAQYLAAGDYGALPYRSLSSDIEELIGYTMIASKSGEYLASGLPMLVNRSVGAASQLIEDRQIGCSYQLGHEEEIIEPLRQLDEYYADVAEKCVDSALDFFSSEKNAARYAELYRKISL